MNRLRSKGVQFRFGEEVRQLRREANLFHVQTTAGASIADAVVSTIPLDTLHSAMFGTGSGLQSLDMTTLFVSARSLKGGKANVLFNFHPQGRWNRITVYSRIYPDPACDREFFSVEITVPPGSRSDPEAAFEDFRAHLTGLGLAEDLRLEGEEVVKDCYPLYALGSRERLEHAIERVTAQGVVVAGRQGRFEYLPTSSQVIARVTQELKAAEMRPIDPRMAA